MPMDGDLLADEVLEAMGGDVDDIRRQAFRKFCGALVLHIQQNAQINGTAAVGLASATGGPVTGTVILPPGSIT